MVAQTHGEWHMDMAGAIFAHPAQPILFRGKMMKKQTIALAACCLLAVACKPQQSESNIPAKETATETAQSAEQIVQIMQKAGLPIVDIRAVTAESDDNNLLGRPGQYVSKAFFFDSRHPKDDAQFDEPEHTVEVFANDADAKKRMEYVASVTEGAAFLTQYQVLQGKALLRMNRVMTPEQVREYEAAMKAL